MLCRTKYKLEVGLGNGRPVQGSENSPYGCRASSVQLIADLPDGGPSIPSLTMRALRSFTARPTRSRRIESYDSAHHPRASHKRSKPLKLALLLLLTSLVFQATAAAQLKETRRVLILNELGSDVDVVDQEIFTALGKAPYHIEFYIEDLDTNLFREKDSQSQFSDWYLRKYRDRRPDLIIAVD